MAREELSRVNTIKRDGAPGEEGTLADRAWCGDECRSRFQTIWTSQLTAQAKRSLRSRSGIGGVLSPT